MRLQIVIVFLLMQPAVLPTASQIFSSTHFLIIRVQHAAHLLRVTASMERVLPISPLRSTREDHIQQLSLPLQEMQTEPVLLSGSIIITTEHLMLLKEM